MIEDGEWLEEDVEEFIGEEDFEQEALDLEAAMAEMDESDLVAIVEGAIDDLEAVEEVSSKLIEEVEPVVEEPIEISEVTEEAAVLAWDPSEVVQDVVEVIEPDALEVTELVSVETLKESIDPVAIEDSVPVEPVITHELAGESLVFFGVIFEPSSDVNFNLANSDPVEESEVIIDYDEVFDTSVMPSPALAPASTPSLPPVESIPMVSLADSAANGKRHLDALDLVEAATIDDNASPESESLIFSDFFRVFADVSFIAGATKRARLEVAI